MTDPVSVAVSSSSPTTYVASTAAALPPEDVRQIALEVTAILKDTPSSSNPLTSTTAETATGNLTPQRTAAMVVFWAHIAT